MERVTVEQNGERFTLEVPEGTSDAEITKFLTEQQQTAGGLTTPPPQPSENVGAYGIQAATTPFVGGVNYTNVPSAGNVGPVKPGQTIKPGIIPYVVEDMSKVASITAKNATLGHALDLIKKEGLTGAGAEFAKAVLHPFTQQTLTGAAKNIAGGAVQGLTAPENLMTLPYNLAAYEQEKIRQNPNAPGLEFNPYAQTVRGEVKPQAPSTMVARQPVGTQAMAGEANRMRAVANMPFTGVSPQERQMLEEDAKMRNAIRKKAFEKVMGPVQPGSF